MNKVSKLLCFLWLSVASFVFSLELEDLVGKERTRILLSGETITQAQLKTPSLGLMPAYAPLEEKLRFQMQELNPGFMAETLRIYTKPAHVSHKGWTDTEKTAVYNVSLALSTLKGLQYFSTSRNAWRTLYESSFIIDGPDGNKPIEDLSFMIPPQELIVYASQKDLTFGNNIYKYTYYAEGDSLFFIQTNMTTMYMGIIPAVGKNKLRSVVAVIDAGPYLLAYTVSLANVSAVPGIGQRLKNSFSTRADAVISWFFSGIDTALR